jgi:hypothetical protein
MPTRASTGNAKPSQNSSFFFFGVAIMTLIPWVTL